MAADHAIFDLGWLGRTTTVRVCLDVSANVRLMTKPNVEAYRRRRAYRMIGGVATVQPFEIQIPADGHWYIAVDTEGLDVSRFRVNVTVAS